MVGVVWVWGSKRDDEWEVVGLGYGGFCGYREVFGFYCVWDGSYRKVLSWGMLWLDTL